MYFDNQEENELLDDDNESRFSKEIENDFDKENDRIVTEQSVDSNDCLDDCVEQNSYADEDFCNSSVDEDDGANERYTVDDSDTSTLFACSVSSGVTENRCAEEYNDSKAQEEGFDSNGTETLCKNNDMQTSSIENENNMGADNSESENNSDSSDNSEASSINSDLIRGHIDTIILKALQDGDRYGYDIIKEIEQKSGGKYQIKQPTLYSCLKRLEVQGFVKSYWGSKSIGGRKKYFTLTDLGKELFLRNQHDWKYSRDVIDSLISDEDFGENKVLEQNETPVLSDNDFVAAASESDTESSQTVTKSESFGNDNGDKCIVSEDNKDDEATLVEVSAENLDEISATEQINSTESDFGNAIAQQADNSYTGFDEFQALSDKQSVNEVDDDSYNSENNVGNECESTDAVAMACDYYESDSIIDSIYSKQQNESYIKDVENTEYIPPTESPVGDSYFKDDFCDYSVIESESVDNDQSSSDLKLSDDYDSAADETTVWKRKPASNDARHENDTAKNENSEFFSYNNVGYGDNSDEIESVIEHEYSSIISNLIEENTVSTGDSTSIRTEDYTSNIDNGEKINDNLQLEEEQSCAESDLHAVSQEIRESSGEKLAIRTHSDATIKKFNSKHYYYANKLRLLKNGIIYAFMLAEICLCFYFIEVKHNGFNVSAFNLYMYIGSVVLATIFPVYAFIKSISDYYYRKRINFSPKNSVLFSIAVFILVSMIVFFLNVYAGLLVGEVNNYISTLILPIVLSTNFVVDAVTFNILYKSHSFSIEE